MLVVSRKVGQSLVIDGQVRVTILEIGGRVQIGIEAPAEIRVLREEIVPDSCFDTGPALPRLSQRGTRSTSEVAS